MTLWIVIVGFIIGFCLAFGIGANDVANSFGTSVGAKVLTLRKACVLASIFETAGAVLLGAKVSSTISKGIVDVETYADDTQLLELGYLSSLIGACVWLLVATDLKLPVSGTHSIVGAVSGFTLIAKGADGVDWIVLAKIVASWFISPMMSGVISSGIYFSLQFAILRLPDHKQQLERGLLLLPFFYAITFTINAFSIFFEGPKVFYFHLIPLWGAIAASIGVGLISAFITRMLVAPLLKQEIITRRPTMRDAYDLEEKVFVDAQTSFHEEDFELMDKAAVVAAAVQAAIEEPKNNKSDIISEEEALIDENNIDTTECGPALRLKHPFIAPEPPADPWLSVEDEIPTKQGSEYVGVFKLFAFLQAATACFGAFAHGGNDVSNAVGPVVGLFAIQQGKLPTEANDPAMWILALGGVGISLGLWVLGRRVIETVGSELSEVTPPSGFSIELGAAITVLVANHASVPVSTTHCKIGSVVLVGISRGGSRKVDWKVFRNIIIAWLVTVPATGLVSAGVMLFFKLVAYDENLAAASSLNYTNLTNSTTTPLFLWPNSSHYSTTFMV